MNLRTTSLKRQRQAQTLLALVATVVYVALVEAFGLGNPFRFYGSHQMRVLLPLLILCRLVAREIRWDGVVRKEKDSDTEKGREKAKEREKEAETKGKGPEKGEGRGLDAANGSVGREAEATSLGRAAPPQPGQGPTAPAAGDGTEAAADEAAASASEAVQAPPPDGAVLYRPPRHHFHVAPDDADPVELWNRAREMVHGFIPNLTADAEYLDLVLCAAERGHIPALAKLGEYALRRRAFVEAYFWTKLAFRRLELKGGDNEQQRIEVGSMLRKIRRGWAFAGRPLEFGNVYDNFPEERGELGRAFLRLDDGIEVKQTRGYVRMLAERGNPDAALFVRRRAGEGDRGGGGGGEERTGGAPGMGAGRTKLG